MRRVSEFEEGSATGSGRESPVRRLTHVVTERLASYLNTHFASDGETDASPAGGPVPAVAVDSQASLSQPDSPLSPANSLTQQSLSCASCPAVVQLQRHAATHIPSDADADNSQTLLLPPPPRIQFQSQTQMRHLQRPLSDDSNISADSYTRLTSSSSAASSSSSSLCTCPTNFSRSPTSHQCVQLASQLSMPVVPSKTRRFQRQFNRSAQHWLQVDRENRQPPSKMARAAGSGGELQLKLEQFWRPWEC